MKAFENITEEQIKSKGVQALADRPNVASAYGSSGMSPTSLKLWFDNLATFLAGKINDIYKALNSEEATDYIKVASNLFGAGASLKDVLGSIGSGRFASEYLKLHPAANSEEVASLQVIINRIAESIANNALAISSLDTKVGTLNITYARDTQQLTVGMKNAEGETVVSSSVDLALESLITGVEDKYEDGHYYISFEFENEEEVSKKRWFKLDDIINLENYVKSETFNDAVTNIKNDVEIANIYIYIREMEPGQKEPFVHVLFKNGRSFEIDVSEFVLRDEIIDTSKAITILNKVALSETEDSSVAYAKAVPKDVVTDAQILKIGGRLYRSQNLIPFPYYESSKTQNGVTFTVQENGEIIVNGTASANAEFTIALADPADTTEIGKAFFTCCPSGGSKETYYVYAITSGHYDIGNSSGIGFSSYQKRHMRYKIVIVSGYTAKNLVFRPMLNLGDAPLPYTQYFDGVRDTKVTEIVSEGANLFDISKVIDGSVVKNNGDTLTITTESNSTGGSAGGACKLKDYCPDLKVGEIYTFNAITTGTTKIIYLSKAKISWTFGTSMKITQDMLDSNVVWYASGTNTMATISEIMVNIGEKPLPYSEYGKIVDTYTVPSDLIRALSEWDYGKDLGYGQSNPDNADEYNYIDLLNKKFVSYGFFDGTEWYSEKNEVDISSYLPDKTSLKLEGGGRIKVVTEANTEQSAPTTIVFTVPKPVEDKVDKINLASCVYATDANRNQISIPYDANPIGNAIVQRNSRGEVEVKDEPVTSKGAVNKTYVDSKVNEASDALSRAIARLSAKVFGAEVKDVNIADYLNDPEYESVIETFVQNSVGLYSLKLEAEYELEDSWGNMIGTANILPDIKVIPRKTLTWDTPVECEIVSDTLRMDYYGNTAEYWIENPRVVSCAMKLSHDNNICIDVYARIKYDYIWYVIEEEGGYEERDDGIEMDVGFQVPWESWNGGWTDQRVITSVLVNEQTLPFLPTTYSLRGDVTETEINMANEMDVLIEKMKAVRDRKSTQQNDV